MNICKDCLRAQTVYTHGGTTAECEGCNLRGLATSPKHIREHYYGLVLLKEGKDAMEDLKKRVVAEWKRIERLKERSEE